MLAAFAEHRSTYFMTMEMAQTYDQRAFRSMLIRKYVSYKPGNGFYLTPKGRDAFDQFFSTDIARKNPELPLTAYFDPNAYQLNKVHVTSRRKAAA
jgi:hypothetical protein